MTFIKLDNLDTKYLGRDLYFYNTIDSTQSEIWRRIEKKQIQNGTLVITDLQTKGVGTHGRKWYTSKKNNIAFSLCLIPNVKVSKLENLTQETALIIVNVFKELYGINLEIKEPNDIMFNNRKVGGILTETKLRGENVEYLVVGIGLNTNQSETEAEINEIATSINKEFDISVDNKDFIAKFCNEFEKNYSIRIGE